MARIFICTVGTSLADKSGLKSSEIRGLTNSPVTANTSTAANDAAKMLKKSIDQKQGREERMALAAELKSLYACEPPVQPDDEIHLLYADNLAGYLCANALKYALESWVGVVNIFPTHIKKLQTKDYEDFRKDGVRNLYESVIAIINANSGEYNPNIILNITGGYKAVVPYMTLLGMLFRRKIIYIFEDESSDLITLPILPLTYDVELLLAAEKFLKRLSKDTVPAKEFPKELEPHRNELIGSVIEQDGEELIFTAFGELLYQRYVADYPEDLAKCDTPLVEKRIKLRHDHGSDVLMALAKRLIQSPYVCEVVNSLPFNRTETTRIRPKQSFEDGLVEIVLIKTDVGLGMVLRTSGRDPKETERIARWLEVKYNW